MIGDIVMAKGDSTMKWRPAPPEMFGYPAAFANGHMFAGLHQDSFVLKLSAADYAAFLKLEGAKPFEPMPGRTMTGFVSVPPAMIGTPELGAWLKKACSFAMTLPAKTPKARPKK
jgi:hypothetical protein